MDNSQNKLNQFTHAAMEAMKRAYEQHPNSKAGSYIMIAFNALIRLEQELENGKTPMRAQSRT